MWFLAAINNKCRFGGVYPLTVWNRCCYYTKLPGGLPVSLVLIRRLTTSFRCRLSLRSLATRCELSPGNTKINTNISVSAS